MNKSPCANCPERYLACHDTCEKFKVFKDKQIEIGRKRTKALSGRKWSDNGYDIFLKHLYKNGGKLK